MGQKIRLIGLVFSLTYNKIEKPNLAHYKILRFLKTQKYLLMYIHMDIHMPMVNNA